MSRAKAQALLTECFGPFGPIKFPYQKMGKIDSLHLFGDTELMILAIYQHNRHRWKNVLDIGANLGLHSICMARLGWYVRAYEPDYAHFECLLRNLEANHVMRYVCPYMAAVHTKEGTAKFIRVLDNLTGNHLEGFKNSYGPTEMLLVPTVNCKTLWPGTDFAKIDSEGNEAELCKTMTVQNMARMSCILEVRNEANAMEIFEHFMAIKVPMWSQKTEWSIVETLADMPKANREGSLFVGHQGPWA
jgi:FkbM family methyltransferase